MLPGTGRRTVTVMNNFPTAARRPVLATSIAAMSPWWAGRLRGQIILTYLGCALHILIGAAIVNSAAAGDVAVGAAFIWLPLAAGVALLALLLPLPDAVVAAALTRALRRHGYRIERDIRRVTSPRVAAALAQTAPTDPDTLDWNSHPAQARVSPLFATLRTRSALEGYTAALTGRYLPTWAAYELLAHPDADQAIRRALPVSVLTSLAPTTVLGGGDGRSDVPADLVAALRAAGCVRVSVAQALDALTPLAGDTDALHLAAHAARRSAELTCPLDPTDPTCLDVTARAARLTEIAAAVGALPVEGRMLLAALLELPAPLTGHYDAAGSCRSAGTCTCAAATSVTDLLTVAAAAGAGVTV